MLNHSRLTPFSIIKMTSPTNKEIESFSNYIIDAIKSLRLKNKRPNNELIFDHISKKSAFHNTVYVDCKIKSHTLINSRRSRNNAAL